MASTQRNSKHRKTLDDIVFEHRNRDYGCYTIRSAYPRRLRFSFIIVLIIFAVVTATIYLWKIYPMNHGFVSFNTTSTEIVEYNPDISPILLQMPSAPVPKQVDLQQVTDQDIAEKMSESFNRREMPVVKFKPVLQEKDTSQNKLAADLLRRHKNNLENLKSVHNDSILMVIEKAPQFPGGYSAIQSYIYKNQHYPVQPLLKGIQGSVIVSFIVNEQGIVKDVRIVTGIDPELDMEATRLVKNMPNWIPAYTKGKTIACMLVMPVQFTIK